jgi:hypothetical protein
MRAQLRRYQVKPGQMTAFIESWETGVVPVRELFGFKVLAAWRSDDDAEFGWLVGYAGDGHFEAAEKAYYASPERAGMPVEPLQFLDKVDTWMVESL